jgi:hypothetical protein
MVYYCFTNITHDLWTISWDINPITKYNYGSRSTYNGLAVYCWVAWQKPKEGWGPWGARWGTRGRRRCRDPCLGGLGHLARLKLAECLDSPRTDMRYIYIIIWYLIYLIYIWLYIWLYIYNIYIYMILCYTYIYMIIYINVSNQVCLIFLLKWSPDPENISQ